MQLKFVLCICDGFESFIFVNFKTYCTASNVGSVEFLRRSNKCVCARLVALACAFVRGLACALACALACEAAHALARAIVNFARHRISSCNLFPIDCENIALQFPLCCCSLAALWRELRSQCCYCFVRWLLRWLVCWCLRWCIRSVNLVEKHCAAASVVIVKVGCHKTESARAPACALACVLVAENVFCNSCVLGLCNSVAEVRHS